MVAAIMGGLAKRLERGEAAKRASSALSWADQRVMLEQLKRPLPTVWEEQRTLLLAR